MPGGMIASDGTTTAKTVEVEATLQWGRTAERGDAPAVVAHWQQPPPVGVRRRPKDLSTRTVGDLLMNAIAGALRHTPDRLLHARRRREARARLAALRPVSVLVLCHGNICRSPFAAALLARELAPHGIPVTSAGFIGAGRPAPPEALAAAAAYDLDLSCHRSQPVRPDLVRGAGLVVVMDQVQRRAMLSRFGRHPRDVVMLGDFDPDPIERRAIPDPVARPLTEFESCYARIARCARELVNAMTSIAG